MRYVRMHGFWAMIGYTICHTLIVTLVRVSIVPGLRLRDRAPSPQLPCGDHCSGAALPGSASIHGAGGPQVSSLC